MNEPANQLADLFKDIPDRICANVLMSSPNEEVPIFSGTFELRSDEKIYSVSGSIAFHWIPDSGARFEGIIQENGKDFFKDEQQNPTYDVVVDGLSFGPGLVLRYSPGPHLKSAYVTGVMAQQAVIGDKSIAVEKIRFSIPNLREFRGIPIKTITDTNASSSKGRICLENDGLVITMDMKDLSSGHKDSLKEKGGFYILYDGELVVKDKTVTYEFAGEILDCLGTFLTFVNGRRVSPLFASGIFEEKVVWRDCTDYYVDAHKTVHSWPQRWFTREINEAWVVFSRFWKDGDDRTFLRSIVHWYVEANAYSGFAEGSIMMAQAGLELVYNWWVVENKRIVVGRDSESINASNKIRLLLSQIGIGSEIPDSFVELTQFIKENSDVHDGPEAIVQIRNAIVHSQREKRLKLSRIHYRAKNQVLRLCLWYIELSVLKILNYEGVYNNRCAKVLYHSDGEERVPWVKES